MGKKGDFDYRYNGQISVDSDNQIIVGQHVSQNANNKKELEPALEVVEQTTGVKPENMSMDNGYMSADNLKAVEEQSINAYIATDKGEKKNRTPLDETSRMLVKSDFEYDPDNNSFTCPGGETLRMVSESKSGDRTYQGDAAACADCCYQPRCCKSSKGAARTINTDNREPLRQQMNAKMEEEHSKEIYKKRKIIVEPVFGHIKNMGVRGFSLRGLEKVAGEFSLVCATHNIKKMIRAAIRGVIPPNFENAELNHGI